MNTPLHNSDPALSSPFEGVRGGSLSGEIRGGCFYLAPIEYYSYLFRAEKAVIEIYDNYQKQSYRNRCIIAGANGAMTLSIPIEKPSTAKCPMKDIRIAEHGNWQHLHWQAIVSAYNSTPFFEFYEDDFAPFYEQKFDFLLDFNEALRETICRLIGIDTPISYSDKYIVKVPHDTVDLRETIHPKRISNFKIKPYYQVFREKNGFLPNLSIIDLLFNLGNETRLSV